MQLIFFRQYKFENKSNFMSSKLSSVTAISLLWLIMLINTKIMHAQELEVDVPFVATPNEVVQEMLEIAKAGEGDYVIDLGSGDGRIVIEAAKRGAVGHGVDIDPDLVELSMERAKEETVDDRVMFKVEDIFETDFSMATVVTIYMSPGVNRQMRPIFFEQLEPGTRVISHVFGMGNWAPDQETRVGRHHIYKWVIPADASGEWKWKTAGQEFQIYVGQTFQKIDDADFMPLTYDQPWTATEATLAGERIVLLAENSRENLRHVYSGTIHGDQISGFVQIHENGLYRTKKWTAFRN